jgi:2-dehydro-3-deoxyphosphogluconate aldolase/(4S)-4-hydroxy-2-oxoglutarate aldolase
MKRILEKRLVPVTQLDRAEDAVPLAEALLRGGLDVLEIAQRTPAALDALRAIQRAQLNLCVGAGTLLSERQLDQVREAGAHFGVAPGLNEAVILHARKNDFPFIPGVLTPTEIEKGLALGCTLLKFFPAELAGGARALEVYTAPFAHTGVRFLPLGGIHAGNMAEYLRLPVVAAVGGSWLVDRNLIAERRWDRITALAREAVARVNAPAQAVDHNRSG